MFRFTLDRSLMIHLKIMKGTMKREALDRRDCFCCNGLHATC